MIVVKMTYGLALLTILSCFQATLAKTDLPSFKWDEKEKSDNGVPILHIHFPDGDKDDAALLEQYNPIPKGDDDKKPIDSCIYQGYLRDEQKVYVTLTGCAGTLTFEIQFRSSRLKDYMFSVKNGVVTAVESPHSDGSTRDIEVPLSPKERQDNVTTLSRGAPSSRNVPLSGLIMRVVMSYDKNWFNKFGSDSVNAMRRVVAHAQNVYKWGSLTTCIQFDVVKERYYSTASWQASASSIYSAYLLSTDNTVNAYVYMTYQGNSAGVIGIAFLRTTCHTLPRYRSSITEWYSSDIFTGQTLAHEIGHNLGMSHDFNGSPSNQRSDSKGNSCTGVGGIMDYQNPKYRWSTCSVEDLNKYYNSHVPFCLAPKSNCIECRQFKNYNNNWAMCPFYGGWKAAGCACSNGVGTWHIGENFCHCEPPVNGSKPVLDWSAVTCCKGINTAINMLDCLYIYSTSTYVYCPSPYLPTSCSCANNVYSYAYGNRCYCGRRPPYCPSTRKDWTAARCCKTATPPAPQKRLSCIRAYTYGSRLNCPYGYVPTQCFCPYGCGTFDLDTTGCTCHAQCLTTSKSIYAQCCKVM